MTAIKWRSVKILKATGNVSAWSGMKDLDIMAPVTTLTSA